MKKYIVQKQCDENFMLTSVWILDCLALWKRMSYASGCLLVWHEMSHLLSFMWEKIVKMAK